MIKINKHKLVFKIILYKLYQVLKLMLSKYNFVEYMNII